MGMFDPPVDHFSDEFLISAGIHPRDLLPEWADKEAREGELEVMQQAYTKDGSKQGNAVVVAIKIANDKPLITVVTECGNIINWLNMNEFNELFTVGKYVMREFPTTESGKAWKLRDVS